MFSGIVAERGRLIGDPTPAGAGARLVVGHGAALGSRLGVGASLAVAGVCLTVVEAAAERSAVELSAETLARTTLGRRRGGAAVNLEPALAAGEAMGGHWVQGHVDGVLRVLARRDQGAFRTLAFELPQAFAPWVVEKGSVALDGVSLTVAGLGRDRFEVALVPHTLAVTTLAQLAVGDEVNFEADVLAKYVAQAVRTYLGARPGAPLADSPP